jgi:tRNA threonylcarbamoyl adenosine modification protein (Sua5/YciO/YrdC/YwlC family)
VWGAAIDEAVNALGRGGVIVLPTDTVYGIGADAFNPDAVGALLAAKGRGRQMPPPVLIGNLGALDGLATEIPDDARALAQKFWPGGLTIILRAQPSLAWDLGETHGTVALRMPDHETALALLSRTGPLAVSSANKHGHPAAFTAREAYVQLGDSVSIYLDGGAVPGGVAKNSLGSPGTPLGGGRGGSRTPGQKPDVEPRHGPG